MNETKFRNLLQLEATRQGVKLFRNNVGLMYTKDGTPCRVGMAKGSSDLVGWTSVTVTPEMVGRKVAVFICVETKSTNGRPRQEQRMWNDAVNKDGGIALFLRPQDEEIVKRLGELAHDRLCGNQSATTYEERKLSK